MKKLIISIMCMLLLLVPTFAFAGENNTANQQIDSSASFDLKIINVIPKSGDENPTISPSATFYGNGGSVTLDYMRSAKAFQVTYRLNKATTSQFTGEIKIYTSGGKYKGVIPVSMQSPIQSTTKFVPKSLKLKPGTNYTAKITGTAIGSNLVSTFTAKVISNAKINFKY